MKPRVQTFSTFRGPHTVPTAKGTFLYLLYLVNEVNKASRVMNQAKLAGSKNVH